MPARRPLLKRVALWMTAIVLLLVVYVLGAPFVAYFGQRLVPAGKPVFEVLYAPLIYVSRDPGAPGHAEFTAYLQWCHRELDKLAR